MEDKPEKETGVSASVLKAEGRNAANDPDDYFDYVMFAWGNCQAEVKNGRSYKLFCRKVKRNITG